MACLYGGTSKAEQFPGWNRIFEVFQGCLEDPSNIWLDGQPASTIYLADLVRVFEIYGKSVSLSCLFPAFVLKRSDWPTLPFVGDDVNRKTPHGFGKKVCCRNFTPRRFWHFSARVHGVGVTVRIKALEFGIDQLILGESMVSAKGNEKVDEVKQPWKWMAGTLKHH